MGYLQLFTKIPWMRIIGLTPEIIDVSQKIYDNVKKMLGLKMSSSSRNTGKKELSLADLDMRVERLEGNEVQQAELVRNMARQVGELSIALRIVSKRLFLATALAAAAFIGFVILALKT